MLAGIPGPGPQATGYPNKLSLVVFLEWKMEVSPVRGFCCGPDWASFSFPFLLFLHSLGDGEECYLTSATTLVFHWLGVAVALSGPWYPVFPENKT